MTHSVQVGAYLVPENARKQVERLSAKGYPARILEVKDSQGRSWSAVRIGDYPSSEAANGRRMNSPGASRPRAWSDRPADFRGKAV